MAVFPSRPFRPSSYNNPSPSVPLRERLGFLYRRKLASHPFLCFGLPFISLIVASSFLLTPATALRYENHDRRNRQVSAKEALGMGLSGGGGGGGALGDAVNGEGEGEGSGKNKGGLIYNPRRRVVTKGALSERDEYYKLMAKDLDDWEQKRVERWKGEPDGRL